MFRHHFFHFNFDRVTFFERNELAFFGNKVRALFSAFLDRLGNLNRFGHFFALFFGFVTTLLDGFLDHLAHLANGNVGFLALNHLFANLLGSLAFGINGVKTFFFLANIDGQLFVNVQQIANFDLFSGALGDSLGERNRLVSVARVPSTGEVPLPIRWLFRDDEFGIYGRCGVDRGWYPFGLQDVLV